VQLERDAQQPNVRLERTGEPRVVYQEVQGEPRIRYERMSEDRPAQGRQQAQVGAQQAQQPGMVQRRGFSDDERRNARTRLGVGEIAIPPPA
jgi:hypothetical protein